MEETYTFIVDIDTYTLYHDEIEMIDAAIENTYIDTIIADMSTKTLSYGEIEELNTTIAGVSVNTSNYDKRHGTDKSRGLRSILSHFNTQFLKDDKEWIISMMNRS